MVRRSLGAALWIIVGLLAGALGAHAGLTRTGEGRAFLAALARRVLQRMLAGRVEIREIGGNLLTGVWLRDVRVYDPDSTPIAAVPRLEVAFNPFEIGSGRLVFQEVLLHRPDVQVVEHADGRLNVEELLRPRTGPPSTGPAPLIMLRDVTVTGGVLTVRLRDRPSPDDTAHAIEQDSRDGRQRVRRFTGLEARLASLRLSSPRERGIGLNVTQLAVNASDPEIAIREMRGQATVLGDTVRLALGHLVLPRSTMAVAGIVAWPRDTLLFDLDATADSVTLTDLRFIDPRFPDDAVFSGGAWVQSRSSRELAVALAPLDLRHAGGRVTGRAVVVSRSGAGIVLVEGAELESDRFDLELARPFLDTLPFAGRLSGRSVAEGPIGALALDIDWVFRDSLVPGWPESRISGAGEVALGGEAGLGFREFRVDSATVDLGTARRLIPAVTLLGMLEGTGTVNGVLRDVTFAGTVRHRDGDRPASEATGSFRFDTRRDTLAVDVDAVVAPLALAGLRGAYPGLRFEPALAGRVRLVGSLDSLAARAELRTAGGDRGGSVRAEGALVLLPARRGTRALAVRATDVDLSRWLAGGPASRLTFDARVDLIADSGAAPTGAIALDAAPSLVAGTALDSGIARLRFAADAVHVDSAAVTLLGLKAAARGALGLATPAAGRLAVTVQADSLTHVDSLARWAAERLGLAPDSNPLTGSLRVAITLGGALDSLGIAAEGETRGVAWRGWSLRGARGKFSLERASAPRLEFDGSADSVGLGGLGFGGASARVWGGLDSLQWFARSRVGELSAFLGGGRAVRDSAGTRIGFDSLAVLVPGAVWLLERPSEVTLSDSGARLTETVWRSTTGDGRVRVAGELPLRGAIQAAFELEQVPLTALPALLQVDTAGLSGTVDAGATLTGSRAAPVFDGTFVVRDATFGGFREPEIRGRFAYANRRLDLTGEVRRDGTRLVEATARLPLDLALAPVSRRRLPDPLAIDIRADRMDVGAVELLTETLRDLRGSVTAEVRVGGNWDRPRLAGQLAIDNGGATIPALGVRYDAIAGRFTLGGDTIHVDSLRVRSQMGTADVTGFVRLENLTRPILALAIRANQFTALDIRNELSVTASGNVRVNGPLYGATLTGQGTVTDGVWYFNDLFVKNVINLDEPWVRALIDSTLLVDRQLRPDFHSRFLDSLRIRGLQLRMGERVWLRSSEANIQLEDSITVDKERHNYRLRGMLQAPRGTYRLVVPPVTREFLVTQGTVRFFGTPDLDAALDIEARHVVNPVPVPGRDDGDRVTVIAHIGGTLLVPRLTLRAAEREMPQAEVISYLMFGVPNVSMIAGGEGGASQRAIVQSLASSLVSGELSRMLISDLGVPLDYVEIRPGSPDDPLSGALFTAGWQVGPRTFLIVNAGFCQGRPVTISNTIGAGLQYRFGPAWRAEASFEPLRTCAAPAAEAVSSVVRQLGLDLLWEKRFE